MPDQDVLANLRAYKTQNYSSGHVSVWHRLPIARRASVFILLFVGSLGELRVVLTKRSSKLRTFPGHISLPGGKADTGLESPWQVSRREMSEEIGLSEDNEYLEKNYGFTIDHVNELPCYLSRTMSAVRPCIGFMNFKNNGGDKQALLENLKLRVNPGESSSIFSCPLRDFLYPALEEAAQEALERTHFCIKWGGIPWHLRSYTFPQLNIQEASWLQEFKDISASESEDELSADEKAKSEQTPPPTPNAGRKKQKKDLTTWGQLGSRVDEETNTKIYDVWGLTANILHDLAEVVYLGHSVKGRQLGEEELIHSLWKHGQLQGKVRSEQESALISSTPADKTSFGDVLPRTEFLRLKRLYKM
ncbi:hypothetical protein FT663_00686 [Candidozyma haemuli var. vulneris]|uniref:Nudix hydrolase domain-containing protein n=1 Tax=Candidozyma haemuli TaxID=45357 RepID=A0A2V1ANL3_9ASCO|nr:hypothetical protein CXQ85_003715 [[Candida] haemuloni]KAF3987524.1 hypothetical protein FT662_03957 [[Candida] haemuloni var. vulneris]KAF3995143.1 hypothetical protein FT663_00686 [[Candida] haemuloni var. vulneris]PVH19857.1 hypothetical protein CXQ85_003715 [[Candida] haemuloni]